MIERINEWGYALQKVLETQLEAGSVAAIFVVFAAGVLTSFTPCVYPMIPVTVTYIGGAAAGSRRRAVKLSVVYVLGMAAIYAALGVTAALLSKQFGNFTRSPWVFGGVGVLITVFGLAMLGWITIPVPGIFGRVQSRGVRKGGTFGAFLMGLAAGFVAAPCTAPVLGLLLAYVSLARPQSAGDQIGVAEILRHAVWGGTLLVVFALGLGLLLMLVGIFSGLLSSLPRAGAWMETIKVVFGVGMLLVAAYFFYQAGYVYLHPSGTGG